LTASEKLEYLAVAAGLSVAQHDLFMARAKGESIPSWALRRGGEYRVHLSDAKRMWRDIEVKIRALQS